MTARPATRPVPTFATQSGTWKTGTGPNSSGSARAGHRGCATDVHGHLTLSAPSAVIFAYMART